MRRFLKILVHNMVARDDVEYRKPAHQLFFKMLFRFDLDLAVDSGDCTVAHLRHRMNHYAKKYNPKVSRKMKTSGAVQVLSVNEGNTLMGWLPGAIVNLGR